MARVTSAHVIADLTEAIASGAYAVGAILPTELALCAQYGTSRHTIRQALQELQRLGLVSRRKNVGTRVETAQPVPGYKQALTSIDGIVQFGKTHVREVVEVADVIADLALAAELGCPGGTRWIRISSLRRNSDDADHPIGWTDAYVDPTYRDIVPIVRETPGELISSLIETHHGRSIIQIRQEIEAVALPERLAGPLNAKTGSPALRITRSYTDSMRDTMEISATYHPAARFKLSMLLDRSQE